MSQFKIFVELTRLNKPIGFMLLFWPCSWGLAYTNSFNKDSTLFLYYLTLFFLGSVLMRSAGCIFNDIVDREFDKKVERTKNRPIASGKISITQSLIYVLILCTLAFLILILLLFLIFIYMVFKKIHFETNDKIKLILIGSISLILMQATIHIGVNIRLFPTTGMTLPFLSYGGSSIVSTSILAGIILNLTKRKIN